MYTITVTPYDPGDYLHPDQRLELIEETSGKKYELYLRNDATASSGEISLFIPTHVIKDIQSDKEYCVVTLSTATAKKVKRLRTVSSLLHPHGGGDKSESSEVARRSRKR